MTLGLTLGLTLALNLAPIRERHVLFQPYLEPVGPAAPDFGAANPGNALEDRADALEVRRKERAAHASLQRIDDVVAPDVAQLAFDSNGLQRKDR